MMEPRAPAEWRRDLGNSRRANLECLCQNPCDAQAGFKFTFQPHPLGYWNYRQGPPHWPLDSFSFLVCHFKCY